jgi:hypothetical protein
MAQTKDSILHDIKQMLGVEWDDETFDLDIKNHINTVFFNLNQINVGPADGFVIEDETTLWDAYIGTSKKNLHAVKTYIYIRVRLVFDPPTTGPLVAALEKQAEKLEWTLMVEMDPPVLPSALGEINE